MKKIAYIIPRFDEGGMPRVLETISMNLDEAKYEQYLLILMKGEKNFNFNGEILEVTNIGDGILGKIKIFFKRLQVIKKIKEREKFDIVLSFGVTANIINILTKQNEKMIISEHNVKSIEHPQWGYIGKIYDFLIRIYYNRADEIVTVSNYIKRDLIVEYGIKGEKITTIYNGVNIKEIEKLAKETLNSEEKEIFKKPVLINVGRLCYQKAQWHLIRIMPYLTKAIGNINLVFIGNGEYEEQLRKMVQKLELEKNIFFLGFQKNPYKYISRSKLFLLSSLYEGFPMVLCEAIAMKIPVVSTDCKSGPREILVDGIKNAEEKLYGDAGRLCTEFNGEILQTEEPLNESEKEMIENILELIGIEENYRKMTLNAEKRATYFSARNMVDKYISIFNKNMKF